MGEVSRGARALVVCPDIRGMAYDLDAQSRLAEAEGLALAIGITIAESFVLPVREVRPNLLFGAGQVDNIAIACEQNEAELVVVDGALTPIQQRNLEDKLSRKVIDRTGLILEIFGERAATAEGRLQVELAHLDYQQSRLVRSWTHLERQRGGFGFLGGPGETQIEADRRMIRQRMGRLRKELEQVRKTRGLHRERRERAPWPVVALVGYTNAGKSTLFNHLTGATVMAEDLLFATLDPTMRAIALPGVEKAILSDTVGFISDLPTHLVAAFRATLEEVVEADLILHVRDMSDPDRNAQAKDVEDILESLGRGEGDGRKLLEVWNKIDRLEPEAASDLKKRADGSENAIVVSALKGEGIDALLAEIERLISGTLEKRTIRIAPDEMSLLPWVYERSHVLSRQDEEDGAVTLDVEITAVESAELDAKLGTVVADDPEDY